MIFALTTITTGVAIEMFAAGAATAISLLCSGTKVRRGNGKGRKRK